MVPTQEKHADDLEKKEFYIHRAEVLGVRGKGAPEGNKNRLGGDVSNVSIDTFETSSPSQEKHADELGVSRPTIARWERDRQKIKSDAELSSAFDEGGLKGVKEVQKRRKATKEEANKIVKLKSLGERSEAESSNVDRKLDKHRAEVVGVRTKAAIPNFVEWLDLSYKKSHQRGLPNGGFYIGGNGLVVIS